MKKATFPSRYSFIFLVLSMLTACIRDADVTPPDAKQKLVIACFISPQDSVIKATVQRSFLIGSTVREDDKVSNAQVILSDGSASVFLAYNDTDNDYTADADLFPIQAGKTYHLSVSTPDGLKAKGSCTIPVSINTSMEAEVDSSESNWNHDYIYYTMRARWTDIPGEANYYRVFAEVVTKSKYEWDPASKPPMVSSYPFDFNYLVPVYSDINRDGGNFASEEDRTTSTFNSKNTSSSYVTLDKYINLHLMNIDRHYFEYYRSKENFSEDPFSEPSNIYSNIEGGLGVFAGYQVHVKKISLL